MLKILTVKQWSNHNIEVWCSSPKLSLNSKDILLIRPLSRPINISNLTRLSGESGWEKASETENLTKPSKLKAVGRKKNPNLEIQTGYFYTNIFQSSFVSLKSISKNNKEICRNPTPSSTRFSRPIWIRFVHKSMDIINEKIQYIKDHIKTLKASEFETELGHKLKITHTLLLTIVDGKVCDATTGTASTMRYYICTSTDIF